jgi:MFS family permease
MIPMRRLTVFCSVLVFLDVTFYAAIAPLLPDYVSEFDLSKAEAGILSASYAAGTLLSSLPAGWVATRLGPRRTVVIGLLLLGAASVVFGSASDVGILDLARFCQGIAGALIWSGALVWLITSTAPERRGSVIGTALGTAVAGALIGPALGALAAESSTEIVFGSVSVFAVVLAVIAARLPESGAPEEQGLREVAATILSGPVIAATAFVAVPSLMFGATEVFVPLRIDELGGGHALIAGGFIAGASLEGLLSPLAGRYSDRVGRRIPYVTGMCICAAAMSIVAIAQVLGFLMAGLIATSLGAGLCFAPALTILSETADSSHLHQGYAAGLANMAWAAGQVIGGLVGAAAAGAAGYVPPSLAITALLLLTAAYAHRAMTRGGAVPVSA